MSTRTIEPSATPADPRQEVGLAASVSAGSGRRPLVELWHPWVSRHWPATAREEAVFVADLEDLAGPDGRAEQRYDRRDVTSLVTALRCGLTVDELLTRARGLKPARLLAAHRALDDARQEAEAAWRAIVQTPTSASLTRHAPVAAMLLPVIISHLESIDRRSPADLARAVEAADAEIARTAASVELLEDRLGQCVPPSERGRQIGALLYDAYGQGAWSLGTYLPTRVGSLVPLRVASLLGEDLPGQVRKAG